MDDMQGRIYDERVIQLYYVPREIYYPNFKKDITPPVIKAPVKPKVDNALSLPQISKSSHIASSRTNWSTSSWSFINLFFMINLSACNDPSNIYLVYISDNGNNAD